MKAKAVRLPDGRVWLRVAQSNWNNPLDPSYARNRGGRWNAPKSFPVLYLNGDVRTARLQIERMLEGTPVSVDDLDEEAYVLIAARLPKAQICADAVSAEGLRALRLPASYPRGARGEMIGHKVCRSVGRKIHGTALRGVWCKSACTNDGRGRELAWFPATAGSKARRVWKRPLPLGAWIYASQWSDIGLDEQADPKRTR